MKINVMTGAEDINRVRAFLRDQGFDPDGDTCPFKVDNAGAGGRVWVSAEHGDTPEGYEEYVRARWALLHSSPRGWRAEDAYWKKNAGVATLMVHLPPAEPLRTVEL